MLSISRPESTSTYKNSYKLPRVSFDAEADNREFGEQVEGPEGFGEWRSVPGFSSEQLRVSEHGYARVFRGRGGWGAATRGCAQIAQDGTVRRRITVNGNGYFVYQLVCRAWKGPQPAGTTCDHNDQNSDNNNASNLSWATRSEQRRNQREGRKHRRQGKAVRVRNKEWPVGVWKTFESTLAASEYYELDVGNLSKVLNGKCTNHHGFLAEYVEDAESQVPLEAGDDSNLPIPPLDPAPSGIPEAGPSTSREMWKPAVGLENIRVSDRGRIQSRDQRGGGWGRMHTPVANAGSYYATVKGKYVHVLVFETFRRRKEPGEVIDHIVCTRKFDNRLCALRALGVGDNNKNIIRGDSSRVYNSVKRPIRARPCGTAEWEEFEGANDAARKLTARFPDEKPFNNGNITQCALGTAAGSVRSVHGWEFEYVV